MEGYRKAFRTRLFRVFQKGGGADFGFGAAPERRGSRGGAVRFEPRVVSVRKGGFGGGENA